MHRIHTHINPQVEQIANWLESDPVLAAQLKEAMPPERLVELLGIQPKRDREKLDRWDEMIQSAITDIDEGFPGSAIDTLRSLSREIR